MLISKKVPSPLRLDADLPDLKLTIDDGNRQEKEEAIRLLRRHPVGLGIWAVLLFHLFANILELRPFVNFQHYVIPAVVLLVWLNSRNTNRRIEALVVHLGIRDRLGIIDGTREVPTKEL